MDAKMESAARKTPLGIERRFDRFGEWLDGSWALRKFKPVFDRYPGILKLLTWLMRIAVGGTFILSGITKGIDPWGTYYKMAEYFTAMGIPIESLGNLVLVLAFLLFSVEFATGVFLLTGCFRKAAPIIAALFMLVMLPLTLWIAIADPVADCGCFGDFFVISNWTTFVKNCFLSLAIVWLLKFNRSARCLITPYLQWIAAVAISAYIVSVGYIGYWEQPLVDFRPYKTGSRLFAAENVPEYQPVYAFIYEKDGEEKEFGVDDVLPDDDSGWTFVKRIEKSFVRNNAEDVREDESGNDFRIWTEDGSEDITDMLSPGANQLILLVPDISDLTMSAGWKINKLYDMAQAEDTEFFAVVAGAPESIAEWLDLTSGQYAIYTAEDTSIKELARGNPAIVRTQNGKIIWKSALSALNLKDDTEDFSEISASPVGIDIDGRDVLKDMTAVLLSVLAVLAIATLVRIPWSVSSLFSGGIDAKKDEKKDGEAPER